MNTFRAITACAISVGLWAVLAAAVPAADTVSGGQLTVTIVDADGEPVPEVAVYLYPADPDGAELAAAVSPQADPALRPVAVMDQRDRAFVPHILVIETGTTVEFPNNDDLLHHVYSFSRTKPFDLPLYGNLDKPTLRFDEAGLVTLGCNIHDGMLGYILVVDTPAYALTDETGRAVLGGLPAGAYRTKTWTPRVRPGALPADAFVSLPAGTVAELTIAFDSKLRPPHRNSATSLKWDAY